MSGKSNLKDLRNANKARILRRLYESGAMSRLQLAKECTLTTAAVTLIIKELLDEGTVFESGAVQRNASGRKEILIDICYERFLAVGVNIESDNIHFSVCGLKEILYEEIVPSSHLVGDGADFLARSIKRISKNHGNIIGIGIGIVGAVDETDGISVNSYGLLPENFPLKRYLESALPYSVEVRNNIRMQAASLTDERNTDFLYIKHAPGLGCASVSEGKVILGATQYAGEIGHTISDSSGERCRCGKRGCLENYVSEANIEGAYLAKTGEKRSAEELYSAIDTDTAAAEIIKICIERLSVAIANAAMMLDPAKIVLAGGIFKNDRLFGLIKAKIGVLGINTSVSQLDAAVRIKAVSGAKEIIKKKLF